MIDQQPYEQGFMPVMEVYLVYLKKTVGLAPADIPAVQWSHRIRSTRS
jgi:hypothetical protein